MVCPGKSKEDQQQSTTIMCDGCAFSLLLLHIPG